MDFYILAYNLLYKYVEYQTTFIIYKLSTKIYNMGTIIEQSPVKVIIGVLTAEPSILSNVYHQLTHHFGNIDYTSELLTFTSTNYYKDEMGTDIHRQFISFENLIDADTLARNKVITNQVEQSYLSIGTTKRRVNLDVGYICLAKLVLASTKDHAHRIYLNNGIYAEITLRYYQKTFQPWEWTYPDYRLPTYINIFNHIRSIYREQLNK